MVLGGVQNVIRHSGHLLQRIDARLQALPGDFSCTGGGAIQIPGAVLDFGQPVGDAAQGRPIAALLIQVEAGQLAVGKYELRLLAAIQVDDALGVIYHIAGALQFGDEE